MITAVNDNKPAFSTDNCSWFITFWVGSDAEQIHVGLFASYETAERYVKALVKMQPDILTEHLAPDNYVINVLHSWRFLA